MSDVRESYDGSFIDDRNVDTISISSWSSNEDLSVSFKVSIYFFLCDLNVLEFIQKKSNSNFFSLFVFLSLNVSE